LPTRSRAISSIAIIANFRELDDPAARDIDITHCQSGFTTLLEQDVTRTSSAAIACAQTNARARQQRR
jgi:hypothetical protein